MNKILVLLGPTSTGKTDLALQLARKFQGELISADSRQVYKGLDIGTGKLPGGRWKMEDGRWKKEKGYWEINGVKIWMYDVVNPKKQYSVADYVKDANKIIDEILARGKLPIIVGGTGLYLKALLEGLPNLSVPADLKLRKELESLSLEELQKKLKEASPQRWETMNNSDRQNARRLVRAIELGISPRRSPYGHLRGVSASYNILKIGLTAPREILYQRSDKRVIYRIDHGMIEEAKKLHGNGLTFQRMRQLGLEYGVLADYLEGKIRDIWGDWGLVKIMQNKIHGFIRRQFTWFKKEKDVFWFNITDEIFFSELENLIRKWYYRS